MKPVTYAVPLTAVAASLLACDPSLPPQDVFGQTVPAAASGDAGIDAGSSEPLTDGGVGSSMDGGSDAGLSPEDGGIAEHDAGPSWRDAGSPPPFDAGPPPVIDAGPSPAAGPCTSDADCVTNSCYTGLPGGLCQESCNLGGANTCPTGTSCQYVVGPGSVCIQSCQGYTGCRAGYTCGALGACTPEYCGINSNCRTGETCNTTTFMCQGNSSCTTNADCPASLACEGGQCTGTLPPPCAQSSDCPSGEVCQNGSCSGGTSPGPANGDVGSTCGSDRDCQQSSMPQCLTDNDDFQNGYCSGGCTQDSDCGGQNVCVTLGEASGIPDTPLCMESCTANDGCRPGYNCVSWMNQQFCLNQCQNNTDCPDPATQVCNPTTGLCSP